MTPSKPRRCAWPRRAAARKRPPRHLGSSPKLLYRWQQAQLVAEVGSVEVARDPEVRQLRAQLKRAEQELDI
jgi:transposase-like protein